MVAKEAMAVMENKHSIFDRNKFDNPIHSFYVAQQNSFVLDGLWKCVPNVYLKPIIKLKNKGISCHPIVVGNLVFI